MVANLVTWIANAVLMSGSAYSISLIGPTGFNIAMLAFGLAQVILTLKLRHTALKVVGGELLLSQLLLLGYFFAPPESNTPNIDLPVLWMTVIYSMSALMLLLLAKVCLDEGADRLSSIISRPPKHLDQEQLRILEQAKNELRALYGKR